MVVSKTIAGLVIEVVQGDITVQNDMEAIANAANAKLRGGGGVDGAIHRVAGPQLKNEAVKLAPISPGQAVITAAYNLPNRYVIHCLGPVYGRDFPPAKLLADCYRNALQLADRHDIESIAFPAISTGVFGYPMQEAATVSLQAVCESAPGLQHVKRVRFVLFDTHAFQIFSQELQVLGEPGKKIPEK